MAADNATIAAIFDEIADLLEIQSANPFRVRAYRNAARAVGDLGTELRAILAGGMPLTDIPGIGEDLALKIQEILDTGGCEFLRRLEQEVPPGVVGLMKVPGLGPKRVKALWRDLDVRSLEQLRVAALSQRVRTLPGFGEKTEARILEALLRMRGERMKLAIAALHGEALAAHLRTASGVEQAEIAGSYRRMRDTVGDLDIVVVASTHTPVMDRLAHYTEVDQVDASGTTRATVRLKCGLQVDVRVVPRESFGAAMVYFTGSKAHNIAIRRLALDRGLKINEYGVFRDELRVAGETEESVYNSVGLPWIPPELREDRGEIDAAARGELPLLVELANLQGDLHANSRQGEGQNSIEQMARAAKARGLNYLVIADPAFALPPRRGLDAEGLAKQGREIDRINARLSDFVVLRGAEVEILEDGRLGVPDAVLDTLEIVTVAVHRRFDLPRGKQTARLLRALDNHRVHVLAQPWAHDLVDGRDAWDVDMQKVLREAGRRSVALELNAHPDRIGLSDAHCRMAGEEGVCLALCSGAHSRRELDLLRFAVGQARRGWMERNQVLNARPLTSVRQWLRQRTRN